jgi:hypothetical protein
MRIDLLLREKSPKGAHTTCTDERLVDNTIEAIFLFFLFFFWKHFLFLFGKTETERRIPCPYREDSTPSSFTTTTTIHTTIALPEIIKK